METNKDSIFLYGQKIRQQSYSIVLIFFLPLPKIYLLFMVPGIKTRASHMFYLTRARHVLPWATPPTLFPLGSVIFFPLPFSNTWKALPPTHLACNPNFLHNQISGQTFLQQAGVQPLCEALKINCAGITSKQGVLW